MSLEGMPELEENTDSIEHQVGQVAEGVTEVAENEGAREKFFQAAKEAIQKFVDAGEISEEYGQAFLEHHVRQISTGIEDDPETKGASFVEDVIVHRIFAKKQIEGKIEQDVAPFVEKIKNLSEIIQNMSGKELSQEGSEKLEILKAELEEAEGMVGLIQEKLNGIIERLFETPRDINEELLNFGK